MSISREKNIDILLHHPARIEQGTFYFAQNVKLNHIHLPDDVRNECYELTEDEMIYEDIRKFFFDEFTKRNPRYDMDYAGRSGAYIVLGAKSGDAGDAEGNYSQWTFRDIEALVKVVKDFDKTVRYCIAYFIATARAIKADKAKRAAEEQAENEARMAVAFGEVSNEQGQ